MEIRSFRSDLKVTNLPDFETRESHHFCHFILRDVNCCQVLSTAERPFERGVCF